MAGLTFGSATTQDIFEKNISPDFRQEGLCRTRRDAMVSGFFMTRFGLKPKGNIFKNDIEAGNQKKGDEGSKEDAKPKRKGHWNKKFGLARSLKNHGSQAAEGGDGGEHDGPESLDSRKDYRAVKGLSLLSFSICKIDEDKGVIDHHTGQSHDAKEAHHGHGVAHDKVADYRADDAKRNADHDNQGLRVASKRDGEKRIDGDKRHEKPFDKALNALINLGLFAFKAIGEAGKLFGKSYQNTLF